MCVPIVLSVNNESDLMESPNIQSVVSTLPINVYDEFCWLSRSNLGPKKFNVGDLEGVPI